MSGGNGTGGKDAAGTNGTGSERPAHRGTWAPVLAQPAVQHFDRPPTPRRTAHKPRLVNRSHSNGAVGGILPDMAPQESAVPVQPPVTLVSQPVAVPQPPPLPPGTLPTPPSSDGESSDGESEAKPGPASGPRLRRAPSDREADHLRSKIYRVMGLRTPSDNPLLQIHRPAAGLVPPVSTARQHVKVKRTFSQRPAAPGGGSSQGNRGHAHQPHAVVNPMTAPGMAAFRAQRVAGHVRGVLSRRGRARRRYSRGEIFPRNDRSAVEMTPQAPMSSALNPMFNHQRVNCPVVLKSNVETATGTNRAMIRAIIGHFPTNPNALEVLNNTADWPADHSDEVAQLTKLLEIVTALQAAKDNAAAEPATIAAEPQPVEQLPAPPAAASRCTVCCGGWKKCAWLAGFLLAAIVTPVVVTQVAKDTDNSGDVPIPDPGNGTIPIPGNGTIPIPGNGTIPIPGNGTIPIPGNGTVPIPESKSSTPSPSPTKTPVSKSATPSPSPTKTPVSKSSTPSPSPTKTPVSKSATPSASPTPTPVSKSATPSASPSKTGTPSKTPTPSSTASTSASNTVTPTRTTTPSSTGTSTPSATASSTPSNTPSSSATPTHSASRTSTPSQTQTATPTASVSPTQGVGSAFVTGIITEQRLSPDAGQKFYETVDYRVLPTHPGRVYEWTLLAADSQDCSTPSCFSSPCEYTRNGTAAEFEAGARAIVFQPKNTGLCGFLGTSRDITTNAKYNGESIVVPAHVTMGGVPQVVANLETSFIVDQPAGGAMPPADTEARVVPSQAPLVSPGPKAVETRPFFTQESLAKSQDAIRDAALTAGVSTFITHSICNAVTANSTSKHAMAIVRAGVSAGVQFMVSRAFNPQQILSDIGSALVVASVEYAATKSGMEADQAANIAQQAGFAMKQLGSVLPAISEFALTGSVSPELLITLGMGAATTQSTWKMTAVSLAATTGFAYLASATLAMALPIVVASAARMAFSQAAVSAAQSDVLSTAVSWTADAFCCCARKAKSLAEPVELTGVKVQ